MDKGDLFSIRKWVSEEILDLYHWARGEMREGLKPALSLWIDTAIKAVLHLEPIHQERLWFCIDELATLQKLDILKRALSKTRKYGLCLVLGSRTSLSSTASTDVIRRRRLSPVAKGSYYSP